MRLSDKILSAGNFELNEILSRAKANVSYLGDRYITVDGYEGSVYLELVTIKVYLRSLTFTEAGNLQLISPERPHGIEAWPGLECAQKVQAFYKETDSMGDLFARFCRYISEFFYSHRHHIDSGEVRRNFLNEGISAPYLQNVLLKQNPVPWDTINKALSRAQPHVSFWGTRTITAEGFQGEMSIDLLSGYWSGIAAAQANFSRGERRTILSLIRKLSDFYKQTDQFNPLQKFREFSFSSQSKQTELSTKMTQSFLRFTRDQFIAQFPGRALPPEQNGLYAVAEYEL